MGARENADSELRDELVKVIDAVANTTHSLTTGLVVNAVAGAILVKFVLTRKEPRNSQALREDAQRLIDAADEADRIILGQERDELVAHYDWSGNRYEDLDQPVKSMIDDLIVLNKAIPTFESVLLMHTKADYPQRMASGDIYPCTACGSVDDSPVEWPCPTVRAIQSTIGAVLSREGNHG